MRYIWVEGIKEYICCVSEFRERSEAGGSEEAALLSSRVRGDVQSTLHRGKTLLFKKIKLNCFFFQSDPRYVSISAGFDTPLVVKDYPGELAQRGNWYTH